MPDQLTAPHVYEGPGDDLAGQMNPTNRIVLIPDHPTVERTPDGLQHIRIMWGQRLIDDLCAGRYRALVCAVNSIDNSHGIINLLAQSLPTSQWREPMITEYAKHFVQQTTVRVVKFDLDRVKVMGLLRPSQHEQLTLTDLAAGFRMVSAMLESRPDRLPVASVCFLGARANRLVDSHGKEPCFESVLRIMYDSGFRGDVYPSPWMWESAPAGVSPVPVP